MSSADAALLVLSVLGATLAALALSWFRSQRCLRGRYRSTVIVTLKTGMAFRGVLFDADGSTLVLRSAQAIGSNRDAPILVDGEVLVDRSEVDFMQFP